MNKVPVDRELLERVTNMLDAHNYAKDAEALMAALAQPAEAEGVEVVGYAVTWIRVGDTPEKTVFMSADDFEATGGPRFYSYREPLILQSAHRAALSAVTAERDRLQQFEAAYNEWHDKTEWVQKTAEAHELGKHRADVLKDRVDKIQAEAEALRKDAERYRWLRDQAPKARGEWEIDGQRYGMMLGADQDDVDEAVDALMSAMAAKEE